MRTVLRQLQKGGEWLGRLPDSTAKKFQADLIPTKNYLFGHFAQLRPNADSFLL